MKLHRTGWEGVGGSLLIFPLEFYRRERVIFVCFPVLSAEPVLGASGDQ